LGAGESSSSENKSWKFSTTTTPIGDHSGGKHEPRYPRLLAHRTASTNSLMMFLRLVDVLAHILHQVGSKYHASPLFSILLTIVA
jgi:hypothetical protein